MIRVMVAEDHTIVREGIKQLIGMARDMQVVGEAANGQQLLDQLRQISCDVVLLDISMPGVNGLEAIPRIRALSQPPAVLVLSMHDEAQMAARRVTRPRTASRRYCSPPCARSPVAAATSTRRWPIAWSSRLA